MGQRSWLRIGGASVLVAGLGAAAGAIVGVVAILALVAVGVLRSVAADPVTLADVGDLLLVGGLFGGVLGFVLGPLLACTMLRDVPLSRAAGETALAAAAAAAMGAVLLPESGWFYVWPIVASGAAAVRLRLAFAPSRLAKATSRSAS